MEADGRPIETAPMDGTGVLLCQATAEDGSPIEGSAWGIFVQVAAWWEQEPGDREPGAWMVYCDQVEEPRLHFKPTHWMALPGGP
jgi:hypothetical protein